MIVCETEFILPDPQDPEIAMTEVDIYAWIPRTEGMPNHRLSLRYRFATKQYEVYRKFVHTCGILSPSFIGIIHKGDGDEFVAFRGNLDQALSFCNSEWVKYHGKDGLIPDEVCRHRYPKKSLSCTFHGN